MNYKDFEINLKTNEYKMNLDRDYKQLMIKQSKNK